MGSYNCVQPVGGQWDTRASLSSFSSGCRRAREPGTGSAKKVPHVCFCAVSHLSFCHTASRLHPLIVPSSVTPNHHLTLSYTQSPTDTQICLHSGAITHAPIRSFILYSWHAVRLFCPLPGTESCGYMDQHLGAHR